MATEQEPAQGPSGGPGPEGPMVSRRRLGQALARYRHKASMTLEDIAEVLACSTWKVRKIEAGKVGISKPELTLMLDHYAVTEADVRTKLFELSRSSRQRGWWSHYNRHLSPGDSTLYGLESDAVRLRIWSPLTVPELLQTVEYSRAVYASQGATPEEAHRRAEILTSRQALAWDEREREVCLIVDESALHRRVVDESLLRAQLERLLAPPPRWSLLVIPLDAPAHPGTMDAFMLLDFPDETHDSVAHERGVSGAPVMVDGTARVQQLQRLMDQLAAAAYSPEESTRLVQRAIDRLPVTD